MESIICPICYGRAGICVGLSDNLVPILIPCYGCGGRGWAVLPIEEHGECGFISHGRGKDANCNGGITEMPNLRV